MKKLSIFVMLMLAVFALEACGSSTQKPETISGDTLRVNYQVSDGTSEASETCDITFLTAIDDAAYQEVGYDVVWEGKEETLAGEIISDESSDCFIEATLTDIPNKSFGEIICVTPYVIMSDEIRVDGVSRYVRVEDTYLNVVNIPVYFNSGEKLQAGNVIVNYDVDNFDYVGTDNGDILTEACNVDTATAGKVICATKEGAIANGMFANFRFQLKEGIIKPYEESLAMFTVVTDEEWNPSYEVYTHIEPITIIELKENDYKWTHNEGTGITGGNGSGNILFYDGVLKITDCWAYAAHEMTFVDGGKEYPAEKTLRMQVKAIPHEDGMENLKLLFYNCEATGVMSDKNLPCVPKLIEEQGEWVTIEMELDMFLNSQGVFEGITIATSGYNNWESGEMYTFEISNMEIF